MREVVADCIEDGAPWELVGWASDDAIPGAILDNLPVQPWVAWAGHRPLVLVAIGSPAVRRRIVRRIRDEAGGFPNVLHPSVRIGRRVRLGQGVQAAAGCAVTVDVAIGSFVLLNRGVQLSHDDAVDDWVTLNPLVSLSGNVSVGRGVEFGTGAVAIPGVRVGAWSVVGAGTVLIRDVPPNVTVVGSPGRVVAVRDKADGED
jgi:acetyltransferase EpsM